MKDHAHASTRSTGLLLGWLLTLATVGVFCLGCTDQRATSQPASTSQPAATSRLPRLNWAGAELQAWSFTLHSQLTAELPELPADVTEAGVVAEPGRGPQEVRLKGRLLLSRTGGSAAEAAFIGRLEELALESTTTDSPEERAQLLRALRAPFRAQLGEASTRVALDAKTPPLAHGLIRQLLAALQYHPTQAGAAVEEEDTVGTAEVSYRLESDGQVGKTKHRYLKTPSGDLARVVAASSKISIEEGRLAQVDLEETVRFEAGEVMPALTAKTSVALRSTAPRELTSTALESAPGLDALRALSRPPEPSAYQRDLDRAKAGNYTIESALEELAKATSEGDRHTRNRLFLALISLARLPEENATLLGACARRGGQEGMTCVQALGRAGTATAQQVLLELFRDPALSGEVRSVALVSLCVGPNPTHDTVELLRSLLDDPRWGSQARLGLGSVAYQLREKDPGMARKSVEELGNRLKATRDFDAAQNLLKALGNSGHPSLVGLLGPVLSAKSERVRLAGVRALHRVRAEVRRRLLTAVMKNDPSAAVRDLAEQLLGTG